MTSSRPEIGREIGGPSAVAARARVATEIELSPSLTRGLGGLAPGRPVVVTIPPELDLAPPPRAGDDEPLPNWRRRIMLASAGSIVVHVLLVAVTLGLLWRATLGPGEEPAAVIIDFDMPGITELPRGAAGPMTPSQVAEVQRSMPAMPVAALAGALRELSPTDPAQRLDGLSTVGAITGARSDAAARAGAIDQSDLFTGADMFGSTDAAAPVTFAGLGASSARSVVYVVDASGPMVTSMPMVTVEVFKSVLRLSPQQRFGVIVFRDFADGSRPRTESFAPVLVRATPTAKQRLGEWLKTLRPGGRSNPLAGLEHGLRLKPDAIFLLSRSIERTGGGVWEYGLAETMSRLNGLNPAFGSGRRPVLIQTIQFLDEDPSGIMQAIGTDHGGGTGYRVVRRGQDLAGPSPGAGR